MGNKIRHGLLGGGSDSLIGVLHRVAANMYHRFELVGGVFSVVPEENEKFANQLDIDPSRVYPSIEAMIEGEAKLPPEERIEAVSVLTPNYLHYSMAKTLLENDYHVICEKPLTTTYAEAEDLVNTFKAKGKVFAVTYTYTGYPMVRQMKQMIANGDLGKIQKVDLQYYQGWINPVIHDPVKRANTWRLQPDKAGISCCIGDIGTHAYDMLEFVTGMEVKEILADLNYLYDDNQLDIDGTVLIRFDQNTKGVIRASQIATGEENNLQVRIYGDKAGVKWKQENPNYLYLITDGGEITVQKPGNPYLTDIAQDGSKLPGGHPEGIFDSMGNIYKGIARAIKGEPYDPMEFPTIYDGARGMMFIEKVVESHKSGNTWVQLD